jgi:hypothetical protein
MKYYSLIFITGSILMIYGSINSKILHGTAVNFMKNKHSNLFISIIILCITILLNGCVNPSKNSLQDDDELSSEENTSNSVKNQTDNSKKIKTIIVTGVAVDEQNAIKNAAKNAVKQVVGMFVMQDTLMKNKKLIKDEILTLSNGFIRDFKVIDKFKDEDKLINVKASVTVATGRVTNKLKNLNIGVKDIGSDKLKAISLGNLTMAKEYREMYKKVVLTPLINGQAYEVDIIDYTPLDIESLDLNATSERYKKKLQLGELLPFELTFGVRLNDDYISLLKQFFNSAAEKCIEFEGSRNTLSDFKRAQQLWATKFTNFSHKEPFHIVVGNAGYQKKHEQNEQNSFEKRYFKIEKGCWLNNRFKTITLLLNDDFNGKNSLYFQVGLLNKSKQVFKKLRFYSGYSSLQTMSGNLDMTTPQLTHQITSINNKFVAAMVPDMLKDDLFTSKKYKKRLNRQDINDVDAKTFLQGYFFIDSDKVKENKMYVPTIREIGQVENFKIMNFFTNDFEYSSILYLSESDIKQLKSIGIKTWLE